MVTHGGGKVEMLSGLESAASLVVGQCLPGFHEWHISTEVIVKQILNAYSRNAYIEYDCRFGFSLKL